MPNKPWTKVGARHYLELKGVTLSLIPVPQDDGTMSWDCDMLFKDGTYKVAELDATTEEEAKEETLVKMRGFCRKNINFFLDLLVDCC